MVSSALVQACNAAHAALIAAADLIVVAPLRCVGDPLQDSCTCINLKQHRKKARHQNKTSSQGSATVSRDRIQLTKAI
eukprot:6600-Heterococcus_DN1.PRE.1